MRSSAPTSTQSWLRFSIFGESWHASVHFWRRKMGKSQKTRRALERAERELRDDPTVRLLEERIAYHRAKLAEERAGQRRKT
jgi:hypothetical protein